MTIHIGSIVRCIEAPDYLCGAVSKFSEYVVNAVKSEHNAVYLKILGDDDRGHWLLTDLFERHL